MAKVSIIALLIMNPATLNSAIPVQPETDNPNQIIMLAPETKSAEKSTFSFTPEVQNVQQNSAPFGWEIFNSKLQHKKLSTLSVVIQNGLMILACKSPKCLML